jgi:predicted nucleic acid-binding protein
VAAPSGKRVYYWDTTLFIAWLTNEEREPEVMEGIAEVARQVDANEAILITSVITQTEIFEGNLGDDTKAKLENLFKRKNVIRINVDLPIAELARQIREYYDARSVKIRTPDSIHLATAILYKADEMHTTDGAGRRRRPADLISLSGNIMGRYPLKILIPKSSQVGLFPGQIPAPRRKSQDRDRQNDEQSELEGMDD